VSWNGFEGIEAREAVMPRRLQAMMQGRRKKTLFDFAKLMDHFKALKAWHSYLQYANVLKVRF
jgi:hypothetical protein